MGYFVLAVIGAAAAFWLTKRRQEEQIALQLSAAKAQAESSREAAQQQAQEQIEAANVEAVELQARKQKQGT